MEENSIEIFTDGSCYYKDRAGGWSFVVIEDGVVVDEDLGAIPDTTSAVMEMTAVIRAIRYANNNYKGITVHIVTDYATVVNCFKDRWYLRWIETDWYEVKNPGVWQEMLAEIYLKRNKVRFKKVKGHTGIEHNERADYLAGEARKYCLEQFVNN